CQQHNGYPPTF
nr:immunoglobulin light chain junction region [Macaca mulatta]MOV77673.1 immunoglobulin light chain junction region [Macaca mulatta]MOV77750.1 immunoglobulin light chain junction region [Macaca mulatta]MOV77797.1 immunoglobulin light chain junction region [Macaca mulatta]MOV77832.1 immunoglobulin light chain junction region [Macaca mulatta]